jgi:hypothetical protein
LYFALPRIEIGKVNDLLLNIIESNIWENITMTLILTHSKIEFFSRQNNKALICEYIPLPLDFFTRLGFSVKKNIFNNKIPLIAC